MKQRRITYNFKEGEIFNKILYSRLIRNNKNVLGAELGPTGSGKSYRDLRKVELWYDYHFKRPFPVENICFGVADSMKMIKSIEKLKEKGHILIFEEAGANLGSLDFQNQIAKMFGYVLQSFRSMNIGIFFNLPYLSMLNKTARMLLHYGFESAGIDKVNGQNICKPFFYQVNQSSGKVYRKYPIVKINKKSVQVKRFSYSMPAPYLIEAYENKKANYLSKTTSSYLEKIEEITTGKKKAYRDIPKPIEWKCYGYLKEEGLNQTLLADKMNLSQQTVSKYINNVKKFLKLDEIKQNSKENPELPLENI